MAKTCILRGSCVPRENYFGARLIIHLSLMVYLQVSLSAEKHGRSHVGRHVFSVGRHVFSFFCPCR